MGCTTTITITENTVHLDEDFQVFMESDVTLVKQGKMPHAFLTNDFELPQCLPWRETAEKEPLTRGHQQVPVLTNKRCPKFPQGLFAGHHEYEKWQHNNHLCP